MKQLIFIISALLIIGIASCSRVKDIADIGVDIPYSQRVDLPQQDGYLPGVEIPGGIYIVLPAVAVATHAQKYLDQYHTTAAKVRSVRLKSLNVQLSEPTNANFNWLDDIQIFISAPGLPEILAATQHNIPQQSKTLTLDPATDELKPYFLADTMYFREMIHISRTPPSGTGIQINSVFHMVANPLY
jgi:hypothetical protein